MSRLVNKEQYFEFALAILADAGSKELNIRALVKGLGVTSGSFYHHFGSWQGFVDALLAFWENRQVLILRDLGFGSGDPDSDIDKLRRLTLGLHHEAEAAIRAWGGNDESVRAAQRRVDDARRKTVQKAVYGITGDKDVARAITSVGMSMLVGYQQLAAAGHHDDFPELLDEFVRLVYSHSRADQLG